MLISISIIIAIIAIIYVMMSRHITKNIKEEEVESEPTQANSNNDDIEIISNFEDECVDV
mgnify:CR=1 FL=1